jgi:hypothetical protein
VDRNTCNNVLQEPAVSIFRAEVTLPAASPYKKLIHTYLPNYKRDIPEGPDLDSAGRTQNLEN